MTITACIPTIPSRRSLLSRVVWQLQRYDVEIMIADGVAPMGDKLNAMFEAASTDYVFCVDDDDQIIAPPVETVADFVGWRILYTESGRFAGSVAHRGDGDTSWSTFNRGVSPKCLVRTELARSQPFGNHYHADREWSAAVQADVVLHTFHGAHVYHYDHWDAHMVGTEPTDGRFDRPQRDVGDWPCDWKATTWL